MKSELELSDILQLEMEINQKLNIIYKKTKIWTTNFTM